MLSNAGEGKLVMRKVWSRTTEKKNTHDWVQLNKPEQLHTAENN